MRKTLVNWLIEVHFKFRFREPCLHLTIQVVALPSSAFLFPSLPLSLSLHPRSPSPSPSPTLSLSLHFYLRLRKLCFHLTI